MGFGAGLVSKALTGTKLLAPSRPRTLSPYLHVAYVSIGRPLLPRAQIDGLQSESQQLENKLRESENRCEVILRENAALKMELERLSAQAPRPRASCHSRFGGYPKFAVQASTAQHSCGWDLLCGVLPSTAANAIFRLDQWFFLRHALQAWFVRWFVQVRELSGGAGGMPLSTSLQRIPSSDQIAKRMRGCEITEAEKSMSCITFSLFQRRTRSGCHSSVCVVCAVRSWISATRPAALCRSAHCARTRTCCRCRRCASCDCRVLCACLNCSGCRSCIQQAWDLEHR